MAVWIYSFRKDFLFSHIKRIYVKGGYKMTNEDIVEKLKNMIPAPNFNYDNVDNASPTENQFLLNNLKRQSLDMSARFREQIKKYSQTDIG